jgi:YegS/Rv2252/BmrU family lipid kinase
MAPGDATQIARDAQSEDWDAIVGAGGDGTINEIVNGLDGPRRCLGIFPLGTANVLASELGLPRSAAALAQLIANGETRRMHLPSVNGKRFVMMAGVGFDAKVVAGVSPNLKRRLGKLAYVWTTITGLERYSRTVYRIKIDGISYSAASAVIANGHYYGGRFSCAPDARLWSPLLHVCLFEKTGAWNALRYAAGLVLGQLKCFPDVETVIGRSIRIEGDPHAPAQGDGDIVDHLPVIIIADSGNVDIICMHNSATNP